MKKRQLKKETQQLQLQITLLVLQVILESRFVMMGLHQCYKNYQSQENDVNAS